MEKRGVKLNVDDIDILGELYLFGSGAHPTVCVCHGVPGPTRDPADKGYPFLAEQLCDAGFNVMIFNFRGTGASGGNIDILGWARDLRAIIDYLYTLPEVERRHFFLMGFSAGAAVSIYVAAKETQVKGVVACACPARFGFAQGGQTGAIFLEQCRTLGLIRDPNFPPSLEDWLDGFNQVSPIQWVDKIAPRPLLIIHGTGDDVVNVSHARMLFEKAGEPKEIILIEGAGHRLRQEPELLGLAHRWLEKQVMQL